MATIRYLRREQVGDLLCDVEVVEESLDQHGQYQLEVLTEGGGRTYLRDPNLTVEISPDQLESEIAAWLDAVKED